MFTKKQACNRAQQAVHKPSRPILYIVIATAIGACGSEGTGTLGEPNTSSAISSVTEEFDNAPDLGLAGPSIPEAQLAETNSTVAQGVEPEASETQITDTDPDNTQTIAVESATNETTDTDTVTVLVQTNEVDNPVGENTDTATDNTEATAEALNGTRITESTDGDPQPNQEDTAITLVNTAPVITDSSYHCDPVIDAIAYNVGDTDNFTLSVEDESPFTLTYSVDSSKSDVVDVTVNENGVFTVTALAKGDTYVWLTAKDNQGLVDEYEIWVLVY